MRTAHSWACDYLRRAYRIGFGVNSKQRRDAFLASAKDAQGESDRTPDRFEKARWLRIAEIYRELAHRQKLTEN